MRENPQRKVAVELNFVEPVLALGQLVNQSCVRWLDKPVLAGGNALKVMGVTRSKNGAGRVVQRLT